MPVITLDSEDLIQLLGRKIEIPVIIEALSKLGGEVEEVNGKLNIEFLANRPDLYSVEGIARALNSWLNCSGLREYKLKKSAVKLSVESSVKSVRPFIACGLVRNVKLSERALLSLMDLQEKLHLTLGRKRRKLAIGVHDFDKVKPPFVYKALEPHSIKFVPLGLTQEMDLKEIIQKHEKGLEYGSLLAGFTKYPIIVDSENSVLSFPPIINGILTMVTPETKNIFIDVTGLNFNACSFALVLVATACAERGGELYQVEILDGKRKLELPNLELRAKKLKLKEVNSLLGVEIKPKELTQYLRKLGFNARIERDTAEITIPPYRSDVFQAVDLIEDIAIGYGFDKFKPTLPEVLTFGEERQIEFLSDEFREIMLGLGFNEVITLTLSNEKEQFGLMRLTKPASLSPLLNPVSEEHTLLRVSLLPSLLSILKLNKRHELPQKIFELGDVIANNKNLRKLAGVIIHSRASFAEMKSVVEAVLGARGIKFELREKAHSSFIAGRCASILCNKVELGYFGELHPEVITNFELAHPVIGFELSLQ